MDVVDKRKKTAWRARGTLCVMAALMLALIGCGKAPVARTPNAPAQNAVASSSDALALASKTAMQGGGMDLRQFPSEPTEGESRTPSIWLHADTCSMTDKDVWSFEKAHAVIYSRDKEDKDKEEITVDASQGQFQQDKMAHLEGGVVAHVGDMRIQLSDMEWVNEERLAKSDNHVSVTSTESNLEASSLRLYPDQRQIIMTNVTGTLELGKDKP